MNSLWPGVTIHGSFFHNIIYELICSIPSSVCIKSPHFCGLQKELNDLDDKYKRAMMTNAQLDNEKQTYRYQIDLHKDQLEDMEEQHIELQRLHKDTCRVRIPSLMAWNGH